MGKIGAKKATTPQIIRISKLLELRCKKVDGFAVYDDGWDDEVVAAAVDEGLNKSHVARVRQETIGNIRPHVLKERTEESKVRWLTEQVALLQARHGNIESLNSNVAGHDADIKDLIEAHNALTRLVIRLCEELGSETGPPDELIIHGRNGR